MERGVCVCKGGRNKMSKDSRGVLRGRCTACDCKLYTRFDSEKCAICFHPPAKHLKLDHNSVAGDQVTGQSQPTFPVRQPPRSHQTQLVPHVETYTPPVQNYSPANAGPVLKECRANECTNKVHYDPELGPFDYCSPQCRDTHLLPIERDKLKIEIAKNKNKMTTYLPSQPSSASHTYSATRSSHSSSSPSSSSSSSSTPPADGGKKKKMIDIKKEPKENLGILLAKVPNESGFRVIGVELDSPGYRELKKGNIKLLDIVTELNEDSFSSVQWFEHSTRDKTRPSLTLWRSTNSPAVDKFLSKVERCSQATHIRLVINPVIFKVGTDFGIEPVTITGGYINGMVIGITPDSSAQLCGVTIRDELLMHCIVSGTTKTISDPKYATSISALKGELKSASESGKHLLLVLKRHPKSYI